MWFIALLGLLAAADASIVRSKRALLDVDATNMLVFTKQFHTTLMHIIANEWTETQPLVEELKTGMPICETRMTEMKTACETCAKGQCSSSVGEIIEGIGIGIGNEIKGFFEDTGKGFVSWEGWDHMTTFFEGVGKNFVGWEGWHDMGDFFENIGKGFVGWTGWNNIGNFFEDFGEGFVDFGKDFGKGFVNFGKDIGKGFSDTFSFLGKRSIPYMPLASRDSPYRPLSNRRYPYRRQINPEVRQCMERCDTCRPFLGPVEDMVRLVCGNHLVELNRTVQYIVHKLEVLYNRMSVDKLPAVTKVRYDPTSMVMPELAFTKVYLTAYFEGGVVEYQSNVPYKFMDLSTTAALMAREYFDRHIRP